MKSTKFVFVLLMLFSVSCKSYLNTDSVDLYPFRINNLIPWAIVGFDVKERNPKERIEMLQRLGFSRYGYGNREKHIPTMQQEWELAKENNVKVDAVWVYINLSKDKPNALRVQNEIVFKNLEAVGLKTQIWVGFDPTYFKSLTDEESLKQAVEMVSFLSKKASNLGCKIALYNHGGWFGKLVDRMRSNR